MGWDGLGLVSYCLVIYFQNYKSYNAGILTVLTNRIGDVAILLGIAWIFNNGRWHFLFYNFYLFDWRIIIRFLIILAAFTKRAQIPFSSWLPAAIAAPTPVSALVHSSTLVTAGVYLLIRFRSLLYQFDLSFVLLLSILTIFISGLGANFEYDLKKIIALRTLRQLGLIIRILFIGYSTIAYFHLLTHAFFKALLFLCAGLIIHCINDSQDIRHIGVLVNHLPYTCTCFGIANISLCGLPFLSGFYRKDIALEYLTLRYFNLFIYLLFFISVGLTVSYSIRLVYYCISGYNGLMPCCSYYERITIIRSIIFLVFIGILGGRILSWILFPYPEVLVFPIECKLIPLIFVIIGGWIGYELSFISLTEGIFGLKYNLLIRFLGSIWFIPNFRTYIIYSKSLNLSNLYTDFIDIGWGEYIISYLLSSYFIFMRKLNLFYQNNNIKLFFCRFILFAVIFIII